MFRWAMLEIATDSGRQISYVDIAEEIMLIPKLAAEIWAIDPCRFCRNLVFRVRKSIFDCFLIINIPLVWIVIIVKFGIYNIFQNFFAYTTYSASVWGTGELGPSPNFRSICQFPKKYNNDETRHFRIRTMISPDLQISRSSDLQISR